MSGHPEPGPQDARTISLTRVYAAPRALVFAMWTDPAHLNKWCHPRDFTIADSGGDMRPGGAWHSTIRAPDGSDYRMVGEYREVVPDTRLVFTHAWIDEDGVPGVERIITIPLDDAGEGRTRLSFHEAPFDDTGARDSNAEGWAEVLENLGGYLERTMAAR